MPRAWNRP
jgi:death-on-curing protein